MNLKKILKAFKIRESTISNILGIAVIVIAGLILFNYFKDRKNESSITPESVNIEEDDTIKHTVAKGEDLWKIAVKYYKNGYKWVEIANDNNLKNPSNIEVGQELTIKKAQPITPVSTKEFRERIETSISGNTYTVVKGDNLWIISVRAYGDGYQWVKIARENKLKNPNLIHPGNVLILSR